MQMLCMKLIGYLTKLSVIVLALHQVMRPSVTETLLPNTALLSFLNLSA